MENQEARIWRLYELICAYDQLVLCYMEYVKDGERGPALRDAMKGYREALAQLHQGDLPVKE